MTAPESLRSQISACIFHAALYAVGILYYAYVLAFNHAEFNTNDWPIFVQYLKVLKAAVTEAIIPFHAYVFRENFFGPHLMQTEFFARVHLVLAPHVLALLSVANVNTVILLHVLINYSISYLGLFRLCQQNKFDKFSFCSLYAIFFLGGFIVSKLVAGHVIDISYFLLPYFLVYVQRLLVLSLGVEGSAGDTRDTIFRLSLVLVYTVLQGSLHVLYIYLLILGFLFIHSKSSILNLLLMLALLVWGGAIRFFPTLAFTEGYLDPSVRGIAWGGYGTWWGTDKLCSVRSPTCWISDFAQALTVLTPVNYHGSSFWEFNIYISLPGVALLIAGICLLLLRWSDIVEVINPKNRDAFVRSNVLLGISGLLCLLFVMGPLYGLVFNPLFSVVGLPHVNNVPSRMVIYPLFLFSCYAVAGWQFARSTEGKFRMVTLTQAALVLLMTVACVEHATQWNVGLVESRSAFWLGDTTWYQDTYTFEAGILNLAVSSAYRLIVYASAFLSISYLVGVFSYVAYRCYRDGGIEKKLHEAA